MALLIARSILVMGRVWCAAGTGNRSFPPASALIINIGRVPAQADRNSLVIIARASATEPMHDQRNIETNRTKRKR